MIDYETRLVAQLSAILPTYPELALTSGADIPCISYQIRDDSDDLTGDTILYSRLSYTIKIWAHSEKEISKYKVQLDRLMRSLGFRRNSTGELKVGNMICLITNYEGLAFEMLNN